MSTPITEQLPQQACQQALLNLLTQRQLPSEPTMLRQQTQRIRVQQLEITPGVVSSQVRNQDRELCTVTIELPVLSDIQWADVLDGFLAHGSDQILTEQAPTGLASTILNSAVNLIPTSLNDFHFACTCCTFDDPICPPVLSTFLAVSEMITEDPWLLLRFRGRERQQLLEEFNQLQDAARKQQSDSSYRSPPSYVYRAGGATQMDETPPLSESLDHFWGRSRQQLDFQHHITSPQIDLVLLRRLGPPPFPESSFDLYDYMTDVYQNVTDAAMALAYQPDDELIVDEND